MLDGATMNGALPAWEPDELGLARACGASLILMALVLGGGYYVANHMPHVTRPIVPTTHVHMATLPKPAPPLPVPPPPVPVPKPVVHHVVHHVIPKPSKIPTPVKHVVVHHHHRHPPPKVHRHHVAKPTPPRPKPPPPHPAFNFRSYAAGLRGPIQRLVHVSRAMRMLKLKGTAYIEFTLSPSGRLLSERLYKSSGNRLIDQAAMNAVKRMHFPSFPGAKNKTFALPIEILPYANNG